MLVDKFLLVLWMAVISFGVQAEKIRAVYQFDSLVEEYELGPITFGLSLKQKQDLYELTQGKVDFRYIYAQDLDLTGQQNLVIRPNGFIYPNVTPPVIYSAADPKLEGQWWIEKLEVKKAWELATGRGVTIADCDAGFYTDLFDLQENILFNQGRDFADQDNPFLISDGGHVSHGTSVVSIMAASFNQQGTNGIAYNAEVIPLQNYNYSREDDLDKEEATAKCILHAIKETNVAIIVLENQTQNGSSETFVGTRNAVRLALNSGIVVVSAGGNHTRELIKEKEDDTDSIIVGALDTDKSKASFSNYGERISISAFGRNLLTLSGPTDESFSSFGGTSGATPQVAATVALMLEVNPKLTPEDIKNILIATRETLKENRTVGGALNTFKAVKMAKDFKSHDKKSKQNEFRKKVIRILQESN